MGRITGPLSGIGWIICALVVLFIFYGTLVLLFVQQWFLVALLVFVYGSIVAGVIAFIRHQSLD